MNISRILALLGTATLVGACGDSSSTPLEQIQATQRSYLAAVQHNEVGNACRLTVDHQDCLAKFAGIRALGIKPADTLKGDEEERIRSMHVTVHGARATSDLGNQFVRREGHWLMVLKD